MDAVGNEKIACWPHESVMRNVLEIARTGTASMSAKMVLAITRFAKDTIGPCEAHMMESREADTTGRREAETMGRTLQ